MPFKKIVRPDELLSVLVIDAMIDNKPEPYSCQSGLQLIITFDNFVGLCKELPDYGDNLLSLSSAELERLAYGHGRGLLNCTTELQKVYMQEVAYTAFKEVYHAERSGKGATGISHYFGNQIVYTNDMIQSVYNALSAQQKIDALSYVRRCGYQFNASISAKNAMLYKYAIVLYCQAGFIFDLKQTN